MGRPFDVVSEVWKQQLSTAEGASDVVSAPSPQHAGAIRERLRRYNTRLKFRVERPWTAQRSRDHADRSERQLPRRPEVEQWSRTTTLLLTFST